MSLCKDLIFLILQFCDEENLKRTAHMLEQETGYFFDLKYFEELLLNGNWEEAEKYLSNFTVVEDNKYSTKIYFEIRKQKFLEALDNLNWQHIHCAHPHPQPHIDTLFTDHKCPGPDNMQDQLHKESSLPPPSAPLSVSSFMGNSTSDQSSVTESLSTATPVNLGNLSNQAPALEDNKNGHDSPNLKSPKSLDEEDMENSPGISVRRVLWSPDGLLFGTPIDAHVGSVNDLAFSKPHDKLVLVSCGDDKLIQVWDAVTGAKQYTFEGHGAPVYSVCPHVKENVHIKAWLFDNLGSRVTYDSPGFCCMRMAYSADAMVQFDTSSNRFLAAGDEHLIKIWDMDNAEILAVIDADGGLPVGLCGGLMWVSISFQFIKEKPYICFNKNGNLLAVSADDNQIKILANDQGRQLLQTSDFVSGDSSGCLTESLRKLYVNPIPGPLKAVVVGGNATTEEALDVLEKGNQKKACRIYQSGRCRISLRLLKFPAVNLCYSLLKLRRICLDVVTPCFSLSRNDSYVISASGRMVSLYNMLIFKKLRNVMRPPPAATCIVFYPPDNNIIAIGMDDSTILIYNIRVDEVISKLEGHSKRISGLAFSTTLNVLVSCGVDTQIVVWDCGTWEKKKSTVLQISVGWLASELSETNIELEKDQKHLLAVHETQLAIYETTTLRRVKQWTIANFCTRISHATYSCDSQWVYGAMRDGILLILDASDLAPRFEIDPSAYLPPRLSCYVDPVVVAAHPHKPYQFALGLSNGGVVVIEPLESEGGWSAIPALEENSAN
ncbi:UNVERIFIED_CONTAM: Topless-related protein 1 [Sesamum radiatum]|uniref:Topless-related protein 1 n=1 Tax=Sesamum radiatum TaxID=300843 RepID=A0AAW2KYT6_SESRA